MRLRQGNERMLRRLETLQSPSSDGSPNTFVFNGTTYPCVESRERVGLAVAFGGFDQVIAASLIVRVEALDGDPAPAAGHTVTRPDIEQDFRVIAASLSPDGSHVTLDLADPLNQ